MNEATTWAIHYMRPDGWWEAGRGWDNAMDAEEAARTQLPAGCKWRVMEIGAGSEPVETGDD
jgi:hypothetical protein